MTDRAAITKWLPDFDTRGNKVTLRHLLGHTSGIVGLTEMPELRAMRLMRNPTATRDDVYKVISRYPFQFPKGTMQAYSNSGFWLLGLIIEKASGMTYEEYVEKRIFEPLGMTRLMYCNNSENIPRRAYGYGFVFVTQPGSLQSHPYHAATEQQKETVKDPLVSCEILASFVVAHQHRGADTEHQCVSLARH